MVLLTTTEEQLERALGRVCHPYLIAGRPGGFHLVEAEPGGSSFDAPDDCAGFLPAVRPDALGDRSFRDAHGLRYAYYSGAMANGIGSVEIVEAMAEAGMLGIFGAAGLSLTRVEAAIDRLQKTLGDRLPAGFNLIHSPNDPALESAVVDLYLRRDVRLIEASAYLDLTLPVVRYRVKGLRLDGSGRVVAPNRIIAKVSRVEVATKFLAPPPERFLAQLVASGEITAEQARWAKQIPMAGDVTAEADSGGHTDNQPAIVLLPTMIALRDRIQAQYGFDRPTRIGAAGGISTPWSAAGAFAMGADYIAVGSVNQSCVESGTSDAVRKMLAEAKQADIAMAPAADMFEAGIKVQVLKRGTMFAMRGAKLFELYRTHDGLDQIPAADRAAIEKTIFRAPLEAVWDETAAYFRDRDPAQVERGLRDPKHKMALVFRWYLGRSSHWANAGDPSRAVDYQVWCGPAMAAFNEWVRGSFLEAAEGRQVAVVAMNILYHAAALARVRILSAQGFLAPPGIPRLAPLSLAEIDERIVPLD